MNDGMGNSVVCIITLHGHVGTTLDCRANRRRVDHVLQVCARETCRQSGQLVDVDVLCGYLAHVEIEDVFAPLDVWVGNHDLQCTKQCYFNISRRKVTTMTLFARFTDCGTRITAGQG